jgi:RNA polymerase sigma-70 factor (ECF subfamily)
MRMSESRRGVSLNEVQSEVETALTKVHDSEWAVVLAATAFVVRDLDIAEECVQEAYATALLVWARDGIPANPSAWLTTVAKRRAVDVLRREVTLRSKVPFLVTDERALIEEDEMVEHLHGGEDEIGDERLRLIFMCCHPSLSREAQMALTLRLVCGMPTVDIARVFVVSETTMAARLTRAKKKIAIARIPFREPRTAELPERLSTVLGVIYLLFTMGHTALSGESLNRPELVDDALRMNRLLRELMPDEQEVRGLLALLVVTTARQATRVDADGQPLRMEEQDRTLWDVQAIGEARQLIDGGLRSGRPGRYALQAAIALEHAQAPSYEETDWAGVVRLYDELLVVWPTPIVALNRAVAVSMVSGPEFALEVVEALDAQGELSSYHYLPAIKADLLRRVGRMAEARREQRRAIELTANDSERAYLESQLASPSYGQ